LGWTRATIPVAIVLALIAWFTLPALVPLVFGAQFAPAVPVARFLALAALARGVIAWSKVLALAIGRSGVNLLITCVDAALIVASTWWLSSKTSATTVAIAHFGIALFVCVVWIRFALTLKHSMDEGL
jgi:O-antigen/teichoic acid export membrane protein